MAKPKIGIILSGCGYLDGAEVQESVLTLLAVDRFGREAVIMSPDVDQSHVINHASGEEAAGERRSVMTEAARISRGGVENLANIKGEDLNALILPGGYGAAKNLCDFAFKGVDMTVRPDVEKLIVNMNAASKPIGFICIAPVIGAKVLGGKAPYLTIGNDAETAEAIEKFGAKHVECATDNCIVDVANKIVSTPAYMLGPNIAMVNEGITKLVKEIIAMIKDGRSTFIRFYLKSLHLPDIFPLLNENTK